MDDLGELLPHLPALRPPRLLDLAVSILMGHKLLPPSLDDAPVANNRAGTGAAQLTGSLVPMVSMAGSTGFWPVARLASTVTNHSTMPMPIRIPAISY
jgi:hypothetical protein